jgi:hypothetical protein
MSASTIIVNDETPRRQYTATSGQTVFDFPIPFFEEGDLTVYLTPVGNTADDTADLLTITTDYTVNGENTQDGGEIVLTTGATTGDIITIIREVDIARTTDYQAAGDLLAETLNREQDINIMIAQQLRADHAGIVSRAVSSSSTADLTLPEPDGNYILGWNAAADGLQNFQEIGTYQGTDATTTTANYVVRDLVKDSSNSNVYICLQASPAGTALTNTSYWALIVDAASAAASESAAASFAAAAATSESNAATSESNAATSESNAATSESNASTYATIANNSATTAAQSATNAAASYDSFDDRYLGAKASDPTLDNDGDALITGALYFDTTNNVMKVYDLGSTTWFQLTPTVSNQTNINTVAGISSDVTTVAGVSTDVTTVAGISANVTTVAGISSDVTTVAADTTDIGTVSTNIANVNTVAGISSDVTTVAADGTDIGTVATNIADVNTVATNIADVTAVADNQTNIDAVAGNASNINQVASDTAVINSASANATAAAASATSAATSATNAAASAAAANAVVQGTAAVRHSIRPSLLLDFANSKTLDPRIDFTRSSTATYYDGKTFAKAEENLLTYSQEFEQWTDSAVTVTANDTTAPDGTATADLITATATTAAHYITDTSVTSFVSGSDYVISIYAKDNSSGILQIATNTQNSYVNFDLSVGTVGSSAGIVSSAITSIGSGWYRCSMIFTQTNASGFRIYLQDSTSATRGASWAASGTESAYFWGAQLEQRDSVTAYTPTTSQPITNYIPVLQTAASGAARFDHDPVTGESKGLLIEEQRTNLLTYSEDINSTHYPVQGLCRLEADTAIAPDGTLTASKLYSASGTPTTGGDRLLRSVTATSGTTYSVSFYAKPAGNDWIYVANIAAASNDDDCWVNVSTGATGTVGANCTPTVTDVGNGWYRVTVTGVAGSTNYFYVIPVSADNSKTVSADDYSGIYIWGAQLEAGSFPTSYIATSGSQVTRSADSASMTGDNFSSWYRQDEGTLYGEASRFSNAATFPSIIQLDDSTDSNKLTIEIRNTTGTVFGSSVVNGSTVAGLGTAAVGSTYTKLSFSYEVNNFAFSHGGTSALTDTNGTVPVVNRALIGARVTSSQALNGTIKKLAYYPTRLTNAELVALTED